VAFDLLMINFRYHIVSLVAVFLALAIGVIAGTTVINHEIVKGLEASDRTLRRSLSTQQDANDALQAELSLWESFGTAITPSFIKDRLHGKRLVLLIANGVSGKMVGDVEDKIRDAGGSRAGTITFSDRWTLADDATKQQLALALGAGSTSDPADLERQAAQRLSQRLAVTGNPDADGDLLKTLNDDGFISVKDQTGGQFPPSEAILVWLSSGNPDPSPPDAQFTLPLLRGLAGTTPIATGEPLGAAVSLSDQIKDDAALSRSVATVDHVDTIPGLISLIAGLRDVSGGLPAPHYGVRRGSSGVAPIAP
jgi:hypothetical protein